MDVASEQTQATSYSTMVDGEEVESYSTIKPSKYNNNNFRN